MKTTHLFAYVLVIGTILSGCTNINRTMKEPNVRVELQMEDFELSEQVSATAETQRILTIDWDRLSKKESGSLESGVLGISLANIPVVGNVLEDPTANYALYQLMQQNPGYDVVFYPQYETTYERPIGFGFIISNTTVKVTARLGKLKQ